ncbi:metallophosphoesterase [Pedobacter cryophilus]|uniref:Calcineurin-like phosphoesterase domain-containing protein n=1 Tax=Pedobacter cryophilus TaxID=2571271 RepID=A0A4U1BZP3_9SPHI|nr:metallophosphoesterase [Pedobacter cryophilus]TKB98748.1 hypothetical protein FA046_06420 [Pedobacter cryophilus]
MIPTKHPKLLILLVASLCYASCTTYKPFYAKSERDWKKANNPDSLTLDYTVFLVGDVGNPSLGEQEPTLKLMESQLYQIDTVFSNGKRDTVIKKTSSKKDVAIFLGDNIYEFGLPEVDASDRGEKEKKIIEQMRIVKDFAGKKIFIPGNHDWNKSRPGGLASIKRQEEFVENYLDSTDVFLPSNGCGGPVEIQMNNNLVVIVIDSEWWLTKYSKSNRYEQGCTSTTKEQLIAQVKDIVLRNKGKNIVLTEHHPLFSNGKHGGYYTFTDYMFPLTLVRDNLFIPLPVIGSIYPLLRQYGLSNQDLSNKDYQQLKNSLLAVLQDQKNVVIATGHEHALQLTKYKDLNHIISGAGSKNSALFKGNGALFGHGTKGFSRLNYYKNGQCWVEFWEPIGDGSKGELVYRAPLYSLPASKQDVKEENLINYSDSTKIMAVGEQYKASSVKRAIFGEHYRSVWATPIKIPYLELTSFAGGLTPLQLGGGNQTTSLRMMGKDGNQYQFRTVNKDPSALLPDGFTNTFADEFVQDQISSAHPFGALAVPGLANAVKVFHANPKLVYMPYSTLLGPYLQEVGGKVGIIEIRPDEDLSQFKSFGYTKNAVSTETMYEKLKEDNDNEVDQKSFLTARLFDMLIGDWDRHEDQWRWAEFEKDKKITYKPIPRDRDQVFTKFDGLLPKLIKGMIPDIQSFEKEIKDPAELSIAARNLDRNLLNQLSYPDWIKIAQTMQSQLTDSVIINSVKQMPPAAYQLTGELIIEKLKLRRNNLEKTAISYYKTLAKEVTISGSDKYEFLEINRTEDETIVNMYKVKKDGEKDGLIYTRNFDNQLTREINIYLLGEKDSLVIKGESKLPIKLRIVGGKGKDYLADEAKNGRTLLFDTPDNNFKDGSNTKIVKSESDWVNDYQPEGFKYDKKSLSINADFKNAKDGISIGLVHSIKHYGFRKQPYSYEQKASLLHSLQSRAYFAKYKSTFYSLLANKLDLVLDAKYAGPAYSFNYYGIGNSTTNINDEVDFYRVKSEVLTSSIFIQYQLSDHIKFGIGPGFDFTKILTRTEPTFLAAQNSTYTNPGRFATLKSYFNMSFVDNELAPKTGFKWNNSINYFNEINGEKDKFVHISSVVTTYGTPNIAFPVNFALRFGAETNIGNYKFYQANQIGNNHYLRGFRNQRFAGRTTYFANSEMRIPVSSFRNYIFTGDFGAYAFYDIAKVSSNIAENNNWHQGYGPGIWVNLYNKALLSLGYGFSKEGKVISFSTGFRF